ncbi:thiamine biosynthesis protein ThiC [Candidatus Woesearchaeota archaeon]|nr:thiamine biosynthesis protein ThiC [Candidatus Woesearchaeota archaeon]|tara:strand:+ start:1431 stop:2729 length:1299 start_codon:yes stop_codon:yes gene_type:complete
MATQLHYARQGTITKEMKYVSSVENIDVELLRQRIAQGSIVIPANLNHKNLKPVAIGKGLKTKINANVGASKIRACIKEELEKVKLCKKYGVDTVMDLSTGGNLNEIREAIINESSMPIGIVPTYQVVEENNTIENLKPDDWLDIIELQAKQGVDFMTIHAGVLQKTLPLLKTRLIGVVSRGGAILIRWMKANNKENPLYTHFEQICDIFRKYDVAFSLGDGLRPGCLHDATDKSQIAELKILGQLTLKAWEKECQVMIEGPGHIPLNEIKLNVELEKKYCHNAPFYVLGPLVTDIAPGYDHITSSIGAAVAGMHGADFLCYVTAAEHLGLPTPEMVKQGIIAYKIAAHSADIAKGIPNARDRDDELSKARFNFDWEKQFSLALDPEEARRIRSDLNLDADFCSMCGPEYCAMRLYSKTSNDKNKIKEEKIT